ncbi:3-isopropylmalate dehydratase small subunit, partial [Halorubrum sp. SP3]
MSANDADDQHITEVSGTGVPIPGDDVDTDQILPAKFMKEVTFDNMADYLF